MPRSELTGLFELIRGAPREASIVELRQNMEMFIPFANSNPPEVGRVLEAVRIADGVHADIIVPPGEPPFPTLVYLHGGGWSIGSPGTHGKLARQLCAGAGVVVVTWPTAWRPSIRFPRRSMTA